MSAMGISWPEGRLTPPPTPKTARHHTTLWCFYVAYYNIMLISSMLKSPPMARYEQTKPLGAANGTVLAFYRADLEGIGLRSPHGDILQAIQPIFFWLVHSKKKTKFKKAATPSIFVWRKFLDLIWLYRPQRNRLPQKNRAKQNPLFLLNRTYPVHDGQR